MDAATRAELDALRVRAYGPDADIDHDPAAVRRLLALEEQLAASGGAGSAAAPDEPRAPRPPASPAPPPTSPPHHASPLRPRDASPATSPRTHVAETRPPVGATSTRRGHSMPVRPPLTRRAAVVLAAIGGALILTIGGIVLVRALLPPEPVEATRTLVAPAVRDARTAYSFAWDQDAVPLMFIPLDGSFGRYIDLPSATEVPPFPSTGTVEWAYPLGRYFGWDVWIAGASVDGTGLGREHCIAVERNDEVRGRCVPAALRAQSALLVSVPFASVPPDDRPIGMDSDERLGFWWNFDRSVTVMLGDDP